MKHASSRNLFAYWNARRGSRLAPERGEIEPSAIRTVLGDSFILSFDTFAGHPFRLAGTRVCALFGREMKGRSFVETWDGESRQGVGRLIHVVANEGSAVVAGAAGAARDGQTLDAELLLLPLYHRGRMNVRLLGILAPLSAPYWLGDSPVGKLKLGSQRHVSPAVEAIGVKPLSRVPPGGRWTRGLTVYEGGRQDFIGHEELAADEEVAGNPADSTAN